MHDILPELLNAVEKAYQVNIEKDVAVKRLLNELKSGAVDYEKASDYAEHLGDALAKAFQTQIAADKLPDGRMYYNIANRLVNVTFQDNYSRIASYCKGTQESLNKAAGIGLKEQVPEFNQDRADGIIERLSEAENYDDIRWILDEPVTNFAMAIVDDHIKANADFQYKAGLSPKIVRTTNGKCCDWCDSLAGTYDYKNVKNTGNDVFRRHRHCRCKVIYDPADGKKVKDVWTKKEEDRDRFNSGVNANEKTATSSSKRKIKIPSFASSIEITKKVETGEYSKTYNREHYAKHFFGSKQYNAYYESRKKKGFGKQSRLSVDIETAQKLVNDFSGKGIVVVTKSGKPKSQEDVNFHQTIGYYVYRNEEHPTTKGRIHYSKNGAHIVPMKGDYFD